MRAADSGVDVSHLFYVAKSCTEIKKACEWVSWMGSRRPVLDRNSVTDLMITLMTYNFEEASKGFDPSSGDDGKVRLHFAVLSNIDPRRNVAPG